MSGAVQSFVDLVYLSCNGTATPDSLEHVRQHLMDGERARRRGDTNGVITKYSELASFFLSRGNVNTSIYFLERSLDIAKLTGNSKAEMEACKLLGEAYEACGDVAQAVSYHEAHKELASSLGDDTETSAAAFQLVHVFMKQAKEAELKGDLPEALRLFKSAVSAAALSEDHKAQAETNYHAGRLHVLLGEAPAAVELLKEYVSWAPPSSVGKSWRFCVWGGVFIAFVPQVAALVAATGDCSQISRASSMIRFPSF